MLPSGASKYRLFRKMGLASTIKILLSWFGLIRPIRAVQQHGTSNVHIENSKSLDFEIRVKYDRKHDNIIFQIPYFDVCNVAIFCLSGLPFLWISTPSRELATSLCLLQTSLVLFNSGFVLIAEKFYEYS